MFGHNQLFVAGFFVNLTSGGLAKTLQSTASDDTACFITAKVGRDKNVSSVRHSLRNQSGGEVNHPILWVRQIGYDSVEYRLDNRNNPDCSDLLHVGAHASDTSGSRDCKNLPIRKDEVDIVRCQVLKFNLLCWCLNKKR